MTKVVVKNGNIDTDFYNLNTYKKINEGSEVAIIGLGSFFELGENISGIF